MTNERRIEVCLNWPDSKLSPNSRVFWLEKNEIAQEHKLHAITKTVAAMKEAGISRGTLNPEGRLLVKLVVLPPSKHHRDEDNLLATCKAYLDGIAFALKVNDCNFHFLEQSWLQPDPEKKGRIRFCLEWEEPKREIEPRGKRVKKPHPSAKYSDSEIDAVHALRESGMTYAAIAQKMGMPNYTVWAICNGRVTKAGRGERID